MAGVLRRVALTDRELVVIGPGDQGEETEMTVQVPEGTPLRRGEKTVMLADLKEGETVTVRTAKRDGRLTALEVRVGPAAAATAQGPDRTVPRLRLLLKIADQILGQMEAPRSEPPPARP